MKPTKTAAPRGSLTYGTSDDEVFFDTVRQKTNKVFSYSLFFLFIKTQRNTAYRQPTAPTVSRPLKDLDVNEGQPIQLTCQVQGFPKSEVCFNKHIKYQINLFSYLAFLV